MSILGNYDGCGHDIDKGCGLIKSAMQHLKAAV